MGTGYGGAQNIFLMSACQAHPGLESRLSQEQGNSKSSGGHQWLMRGAVACHLIPHLLTLDVYSKSLPSSPLPGQGTEAGEGKRVVW